MERQTAWLVTRARTDHRVAEPNRAARLTIEMTRRADGGSVLRCRRSDGSVTWQRNEGRSAAFFPLHDLTHYAVETELGFDRGFYGLIADGWEIEETEGKSARGPLPPEAVAVEHLVGMFDLERAGTVTWTADELNAEVARRAREDGRELPRALTGDDIARLRNRLHALYARWAALRPESTLMLELA